MVNLSDKISYSGDMNHKYPDATSAAAAVTAASSEESQVTSEIKKTCADCGTSKTPLWRSGPAGPKSLCNACGIRSRKKRRAFLGLNKGHSEEKKSKKSNHNAASTGTSNGKLSSGKLSNGKLGTPLHRTLLALGRQVMMQRSKADKQRRKLGEEEQAAVLLMALSYGSVYA